MKKILWYSVVQISSTKALDKIEDKLDKGSSQNPFLLIKLLLIFVCTVKLMSFTIVSS